MSILRKIERHITSIMFLCVVSLSVMGPLFITDLTAVRTAKMAISITVADTLRQRPIDERLVADIEDAGYERTFAVRLGNPEKYLFHVDRGALPFPSPLL